MGGVFLADLWMNRQTSFAGILQARGWAYASLAMLAVVARLRRTQWLDALDRRYFRERLNAQRLLRGIGEEIRNATTLDDVALRVVSRIEAALHPAFAALLVRQPGQALFQTVAISPASREPFSLPSASHTQVELIVPIHLGAEDLTEAILALGAKRSEEPYSAEDDDLLGAIADNVAWVLRRAPATKTGVDGFEECPECGRCFGFGTGRCESDGTALVLTSLPRLLVDRYELGRRVGRGGMGAVYAAFDRALNREVAVKVLRDDLIMPGAGERFQAEARLAAALAHRNVVSVHDIGVTAAGRAFFVMELLNGVTLRDELRRVGRLPAARVLQIARDVGSGVDAAHRRQMIHRDLKPENVVLCRVDGIEVAKVLDFGLAKAVEASGETPTRFTTPGMIAGTPPYMAPEHLSGGDPSSDWDLWAIAVMAFEMITGALPATSSGRTLNLEGLPTDGLRGFFSRALSRNPIDRPATVAEFLDELARELGAAEHARL
jgi:serine/threonine-protein kinase